MDPGSRGAAGGAAMGEGERWLAVAERLLEVRDLVGSKQFAERAMEADPLLDGVDQILAVADVLLASQRRVNNHVDWYAVLHLPPPTPADPGDPAAIRRQYRRLAILLHPERNKGTGAESAYRLVGDAYAVLSDPTKKSLYDAELHIATSTAAASAATTSSKPVRASFSTPSTGNPFWTACPSCCHVHQYSREYLNRSLRCPNCRRTFQAEELSEAPPIVPGTDMYYCSWGFFPLGFPGAPNFFASGGAGAPDLNNECKPFFPTFANSGKNKPFEPSQHSKYQQDNHNKAQNNSKEGNLEESKSAGPLTRSRKKMAVKKVGRPRKSPLGSGSRGKKNASVESPAEAPAVVADPVVMPTNTGGVDININPELNVGSGSGVRGEDDYSINFHINVNSTDEILDNLQNLPFLRDEELHLRMP